MQNRDIEFRDNKVILSRETYEELKAFCAMHGETDLPGYAGGIVRSEMYIIAEGPSPEIFTPIEPEKKMVAKKVLLYPEEPDK